MKPYFTLLLAGSLACASLAFGQDADNTKMNKRDQGAVQPATVTKADVEVLRKIRRALTSDKSLSTYAQNIKITVKNGAATLRGPVRTSDEKIRIEDLAKASGAASVMNELEIGPTQ